MKNKLSAALATMTVLFFVVAFHAHGMECENEFEQGTFVIQDGIVYSIGDDHVDIVDMLPGLEYVCIPAMVNDKPVRCHYYSPFPWHLRDSAKEIVIEEGVQGIYQLFFFGWQKLESVEINTDMVLDPDDDTTSWSQCIGFVECPQLRTLIFSKSVSGDVEEFEIRRCPKLSEVILPDDLWWISYMDAVPSLEELSLPASLRYLQCGETGLQNIAVDPRNPDLESIDGVLFEKKSTALVYYPPMKEDTAYVIPEGTISASINANNLVSLTIPASLETIELNCPALTTIVVSNENEHMMVIEDILYSKDGDTLLFYPATKTDESFWVSKGVTSVTIKNAFVKHLVFQDGMVSMQGSTLACDALESITFPKTTNEIIHYSHWDSDVYKKCPQLNTFYIDTENPYMQSDSGVAISGDGKTLILVPPGYQSTLRIPEGVESIADYAFRFCDGIEQLVLPSTLVNLDSQELSRLSGLKTYTVSDANPAFACVDGVLFSKDGKTLVAYPRQHAMAYTVPLGTHTIGAHAFYANDSIESISMPRGIETISESAFELCIMLRAISLPIGLKSIAEYAFFECFSLEKAIIPTSIQSIEACAFGYSNTIEEWGEDAYHDFGEIKRLALWVPPTLHTLMDDQETPILEGRDENQVIVFLHKGSLLHIEAVENAWPFCFIEDAYLYENLPTYGMLTTSLPGETVAVFDTHHMEKPALSVSDGSVGIMLEAQDEWVRLFLLGDVYYVSKGNIAPVTSSMIGRWRDDATSRGDAVLYESPSKDAEVTYRLSDEEDIVLHEKIGAWFRATVRGMHGFIHTSECDPVLNPQYYPVWGFVNSQTSAALHVYPDDAAPTVADLRTGEHIVINRISSDWLYVYTRHEYKSGFIRAEDVEVVWNGER